MNQFLKVLIVNLVLAVCAAHGEEAKQWGPAGKADPRKAKATRGRRLASIQEANQNSYRSTRGYKSKDGLDAHAGLAIGAGMQKESSAFGGVGDSQAFGAAPSIGLSLDLKYARYFGLEQDAYYQMNGSTADLGGATEKMQSMGSLTTVKGQLPFALGSVRLSPKVGVGFAYLKETSQSESATSTFDSSSTASGAFGVVGLDIQPMENLTIMADYAKSLAASVTIKSGPLDEAADSAAFDRIRIGVLYRFMPRFQGGAQFIQRGVSHTLPTLTPGSNQDGTTNLRQFQAVIQYEL